MRILLPSLGVLLVVLGLVYHLAALAVFNALVPKDGGVTRLAAHIPYGPHARQRLDLYAPDTADSTARDKGTGPLPVLLFVYGGSWDSGRKEDYAFAAHAFAAQGFLTAVADYRLVPEVHYPGFVDDTGMVITWLAENAPDFGGDPGRIFIVGHSAGAYNAVQAVLRHDLHRHVTAMVSLAGPFDFLPLDSPKSRAAFARVPDLHETQPVNGDLAQAPPLLLLHGRDDKTVGLHNSRNLNAAYLRAGRASELKIYDALAHVGILLALARPMRDRAPVLADVLAFLHRYR